MSGSVKLLSSKLAVVTGAGSGIGRATALRMAENGARVALADLNADAVQSTLQQLPDPKQHFAQSVDIAQRQSVESFAAAVRKHFGTAPQAVVNCAGITQDTTLLKMTDDKWQRVLDVNLKGTFLITQTFVRQALEQDANPATGKTRLSVVNVSSIIGKVGNFGQTNYASSKSGVIAFSKSAARELAAKGIRVNALLPGFITTPMTKDLPKNVIEQVVNEVPMRRFGEPSEIADAIVWLASDLSSYVTGAQIEVTGGLYM